MIKWNSKLRSILENLLIIVFVVSFKLFILDSLEVQGASMYPTLNENEHNDYVIVEKYKHFTKDYKRGDIVILKSHDENNNIYIKRIIGFPNETVEIKDGLIYINGNLLKEEYLDTNIRTSPSMTVKVPNDSVFVLGDNRQYSKDSRSIGPIAIKDILGRATYKINILDKSLNKLK